MLSAAVPGRQTPFLLVSLLAGTPQAPPPRYAAEMLECAVFRETVRTNIRSESGAALRLETAGRDGLLLVQAVRSDSGAALIAWYDSLSVWRQGPEGRMVPDAEGLLGGQWRGILSAEGRYAGVQVPFVPDEVAEVVDLRGLLGDFFPRLTPGELKTVRGGEGRYEWSVTAVSDTTGAVNDTLQVPMRRESTEKGNLKWDRLLGPVEWERTITVAGDIAAKGPIRRGIHSVVTQRIQVTRLPNHPCG